MPSAVVYLHDPIAKEMGYIGLLPVRAKVLNIDEEYANLRVKDDFSYGVAHYRKNSTLRVYTRDLYVEAHEVELESGEIVWLSTEAYERRKRATADREKWLKEDREKRAARAGYRGGYGPEPRTTVVGGSSSYTVPRTSTTYGDKATFYEEKAALFKEYWREKGLGRFDSALAVLVRMETGKYITEFEGSSLLRLLAEDEAGLEAKNLAKDFLVNDDDEKPSVNG